MEGRRFHQEERFGILLRFFVLLALNRLYSMFVTEKTSPDYNASVSAFSAYFIISLID